MNDTNNQGKVLIFCDGVCDMAEQALDQADLEAESCSDLHHAIRKAVHHDFNGVIVGCEPSDVDVLELVSTLEDIDDTIPVIVTGQAVRQADYQYLKAQGCHCILDRIGSKRWIDKVKAICGNGNGG